MDFKPGTEYTLDEIVSSVRGEVQSYLPQFDGVIVCGRFSLDMNPNAPYEVLVGDLPKVVRKAELLVQQGHAIPVFIKLAPNRWRYHGLMAAAEYVTDRTLVSRRASQAGRTDRVAGVLVLRDAS
jgi:hypothetical protein